MEKRRVNGECSLRKRKDGCEAVRHVSSMLGHNSAGFTLATYTHATNKVQEQAAAKMGNLLKTPL